MMSTSFFFPHTTVLKERREREGFRNLNLTPLKVFFCLLLHSEMQEVLEDKSTLKEFIVKLSLFYT